MKREKRGPRNTVILICLTVFLVTAFFMSLLIGRYSVSGKDVVRILGSRVLPIKQTWTKLQENMVLQVRLPRVIVAILVGAALSVAGETYQSIFQNPMASPDILGASTAAGFGAALAILLKFPGTIVTAAAFGMSIISVILVLFIARICKGSYTMNLILTGVIIGSLFQAATSYIKLIADPNNTLPEITYWLMGSLAGVKPEDLSYIWILIVLGLVPVFLLRWKMNLLTLTDEESQAMGVNTKRVRVILIIASTLLTAASVAVSGIIGWVGLVIPHISRRIVGSDCRVLVPASALTGGLFLLLVDNLARSLYSTELPLGIITSVIGAPFFLYLMIKGRNS